MISLSIRISRIEGTFWSLSTSEGSGRQPGKGVEDVQIAVIAHKPGATSRFAPSQSSVAWQ
jgi:hypothetical protein